MNEPNHLPETFAPTGNAAIDRAIAATAPQPARMVPIRMKLCGNEHRIVDMVIPSDITDEECFGLMNGCMQAIEAVRSQRKPASPILVPSR